MNQSLLKLCQSCAEVYEFKNNCWSLLTDQSNRELILKSEAKNQKIIEEHFQKIRKISRRFEN